MKSSIKQPQLEKVPFENLCKAMKDEKALIFRAERTFSKKAAIFSRKTMIGSPLSPEQGGYPQKTAIYPQKRAHRSSTGMSTNRPSIPSGGEIERRFFCAFPQIINKTGPFFPKRMGIKCGRAGNNERRLFQFSGETQLIEKKEPNPRITVLGIRSGRRAD